MNDMGIDQVFFRDRCNITGTSIWLLWLVNEHFYILLNIYVLIVFHGMTSPYVHDIHVPYIYIHVSKLYLNRMLSLSSKI